MTNAPEWIKEQTNKLIETAYQRGYKVGREEGFDEWVNTDVNASIEQGHNEAWKAAKKLISMGYRERYEVLGNFVSDFEIFKNYSASEAISKIKAYEEKQKQEEDSEIRVGDEIYILDKNYLSVVTSIYEVNGNKNAVCITQNGKWNIGPISDLHKTGRHFPEIEEVLKKMQGE